MNGLPLPVLQVLEEHLTDADKSALAHTCRNMRGLCYFRAQKLLMRTIKPSSDPYLEYQAAKLSGIGGKNASYATFL
jgi:hypothetical protein